MASIGHPLIGDKLYGDGEGEFDLTCKSVSFKIVINDRDYVVNAIID